MMVDVARTVRRLIVLSLAAAIATVVALTPFRADAHSGLSAASPGPGVVAGGEITEIQLFYGDIITEVDGTVTAPDGTVLDAEFVMESEIMARVDLGAALDQPGEYAVRHEVLSIDGDRVEAAYLFTYDPAAPPPQLEFVEESDDDGGLAWWAWVLFGVGAVVIVVLAWRLADSLRRARAA